MKTTRIDLIALNGGDGAHYKYEEVAERLWELAHPSYNPATGHKEFIKETVKILVENFSDDES